nr:GAF domain-containing protein [Cyanobium gracile]
MLLDTASDQHLDRIIELARATLGVPIALISLVDQDRQWFLAKTGIEATETSRDVAFCAHAILSEEVMVVPDASQDQRFSSNPLVTGEPGIRFYAGAPLRAMDGHLLGTLCVIDQQAHGFNDDQKRILRMFSEQVSREIEIRQRLARCPVTGLWNRGAFLFLCEKEFQRARRLGRNDVHLLGFAWDPPPVPLTEALLPVFGPDDLVGRIADRMFAALMIDSTRASAMVACRSLDAAAGALQFDRRRSRPAARLRIGLTDLAPSDLSMADLLVRAENALYLTEDEAADPVMAVWGT